MIGKKVAFLCGIISTLSLIALSWISDDTNTKKSVADDFSFDVAEETRWDNIPTRESTIIFYNIFIPNDASGVKHAKQVLTEQLEQVAAMLTEVEINPRTKAILGSEHSFTLLYNLIGNELAYPREKVEKLCLRLHPRLACQRLGYYETATESVTLQDIYDFCQHDDDSSDTRVTYIHSKGSYHQTPVNTYWRREMTNSALHPDCLLPPDDTCNVCGAQFYTEFTTFYPGNMWTAKCSYVRKLLPPKVEGEYETRKRESIKKFLEYRMWGLLESTLLPDRVDYFGLSRYSLEHWIGSHPSIIPCELHGLAADLEDMVKGKITPDDYNWGMGPRRESLMFTPKAAKKRNGKKGDAQFKEYFFLPGNLLKWFTLYGSEGVPATDSWAWEAFPAGDRWKGLVYKHKENAVEEMIKQSKKVFHPTFESADDGSLQFPMDQEVKSLLSGPTAPLIVFYEYTAPFGRSVEDSHGLKKQLSVLRSVQRPVILYYTILGESSLRDDPVSNACHDKSNDITCRKLGKKLSSKAHGETFQHLHNFCHANPSLSVTHLRNQWPQMEEDDIHAYTAAVTSHVYEGSSEICNVRGMEFNPLPFHRFTGNMFSAECDYVRKLLPPRKFETDMNDIAGETLLSLLSNMFTSELYPFTPKILGMRQHWVEHWIGSHPDFQPCDTSPTTGSTTGTWNFFWAKAPRGSSAPNQLMSPEKEKQVLQTPDVVLREYYFLAGKIYCWYKLYDKAPSWDSWVWEYYPQGEMWRFGNSLLGSGVVEELTSPATNDGVPF